MRTPPDTPFFYDPLTNKNRELKEVVTCHKCNCNWMELVLVQQFPKDHAVILSQKPPRAHDVGFYMFRCPKCLEIYEPRLVGGGLQDATRKAYDQFVNLMESDGKKPEGEDI